MPRAVPRPRRHRYNLFPGHPNCKSILSTNEGSPASFCFGSILPQMRSNAASGRTSAKTVDPLGLQIKCGTCVHFLIVGVCVQLSSMLVTIYTPKKPKGIWFEMLEDMSYFLNCDYLYTYVYTYLWIYIINFAILIIFRGTIQCIKYIHTVVQLSPLPVSKTFSSL